MRSQRLKISYEEFNRIPRKLGWKYEYFSGKGYISPRGMVVVRFLRIEPRPTVSIAGIRLVEEADREKLKMAFIVGFRDSVDFCDFTLDRIKAAANRRIGDYFAGNDGEPLPASRLFVKHGAVAGAALLTRARVGPQLDMLFVRPRYRRQGIARALLYSALNDLYPDEAAFLWSRHLLTNEVSAAWHEAAGFVEMPDMDIVRLRAAHPAWELERLSEIGELTPEMKRALEVEEERWDREVDRLREIEEKDGYSAVRPSGWFYKF